MSFPPSKYDKFLQIVLLTFASFNWFCDWSIFSIIFYQSIKINRVFLFYRPQSFSNSVLSAHHKNMNVHLGLSSHLYGWKTKHMEFLNNWEPQIYELSSSPLYYIQVAIFYGYPQFSDKPVGLKQYPRLLILSWLVVKPPFLRKEFSWCWTSYMSCVSTENMGVS